MPKRVAIQGEKASFHDRAATQFFGDKHKLVCCRTFAETIRSLVKNDADYSVCAIENSLYGSVNEVYDLLYRHHFWIIGEVYLKVEQSLIGLKGTKLRQIKEVYKKS